LGAGGEQEEIERMEAASREDGSNPHFWTNCDLKI
jgi:hypothetical protein